MKKYLTAENTITLFLFIVFLGMIILIISFFSNPKADRDQLLLVEQKLKDQEKEIIKLNDQQQEIVADDLKRDSILQHQLAESDKIRETKIYYINKTKDEKINRISSSDFTNDSIRRAFSN